MKACVFFLVVALTPSTINAGECGLEVNEYIVKTTDLGVFEDFVRTNDLQLGPLITYPDPPQEVLERFSCYHIVTIPQMQDADNLIEQLKALHGVEWVEFDQPAEIEPVESKLVPPPAFYMPDTFDNPYIPNDPWFPEQWGIIKTATHWAWNVSTGEGIIMGMMDSGVDTLHEDLVENLDLEMGWNFIMNNNDLSDFSGHGTWVTGIAAARIDNEKGIAGVAGNATIWPLVASGSGAFINAALYAADNGVHILNMSWHSTAGVEAFQDAADYAWENGVFMCAAAGNGGSETVRPPALCDYVMSVGGTDSDDHRWDDGDQASSYGPEVDIFAPADSIITTIRDSTYGYSFPFSSGTSFSSAIVAGIAALIWSANPTYTNQDIWNRLIQTADTITIDKGEVLRVNAARAVGIEYEDVAEHPVAAPGWSVTPVGREITLSFTDHPQGFHASIFDASGRQVDELHSAHQSGILCWGEDSSPGVYFIREIPGLTPAKKVVLVK